MGTRKCNFRKRETKVNMGFILSDYLIGNSIQTDPTYVRETDPTYAEQTDPTSAV